LAAGSYSLLVRSRDTFGRLQESTAFQFKIVPPYWQTAWFKGVEVLFFVLLVFGSGRINQKSHEKYRLLTSILTIVTVVMMIELLQNMAGSYFDSGDSLALAFGIDVAVALLVFPIEQVLKKLVSGKLKVIDSVPLKKAKVPIVSSNKK
jgi:chromate transport protein ChrA